MISLIAREEIWYFAIILFQGVRGYERLNLGSSKALYSPLSRQYKCPIETGTWLGDGIQAALESGFRQVISCDINEELVMQARSRFQNQPVQVHLGSSEQVLKTLMLDVSEPTVFFLDAHAMPPSSEAQVFSAATLLPGHEDDQSLQCPLQQEIKIILESGYSGHTISIDDRQCFDT